MRDGRGHPHEYGAQVDRARTLRIARAEIDLIDRWDTMALWERRRWYVVLTATEQRVVDDAFGHRDARGG